MRNVCKTEERSWDRLGKILPECHCAGGAYGTPESDQCGSVRGGRHHAGRRWRDGTLGSVPGRTGAVYHDPVPVRTDVGSYRSDRSVLGKGGTGLRSKRSWGWQ